MPAKIVYVSIEDARMWAATACAGAAVKWVNAVRLAERHERSGRRYEIRWWSSADKPDEEHGGGLVEVAPLRKRNRRTAQ